MWRNAARIFYIIAQSADGILQRANSCLNVLIVATIYIAVTLRFMGRIFVACMAAPRRTAVSTDEGEPL